jgi:uncharacterized protein
MKRKAIETLKKWKNKPKHKPMIIRGARQVGKTWLMKEFGATEYKNTAYINFENNPVMEELFSVDMDIPRIVEGLELETSEKIVPKKTLIIFDEVQECPNALTSLKYFYENAPEYDIVAAGSMLGVALHNGKSFPVGKIEFMDLYPLSFEEFLEANNAEKFVELLNDIQSENIKVFKSKYISYLKQYYYVGGMPEVVSTFVETHDYKEVRNVQKTILDAYKEDFSKHIPTATKLKLDLLWDSIPTQLTQESKKFVYKKIKSDSRAKEFEEALAWLLDCGLVYKINRATKPALPLKAYEDSASFKLFILDVGLLSALSSLPARTLIEGDKIFTEFHGALAEQFVLQQLKTLDDLTIAYWISKSNVAEIDFLIQLDGYVIPVEVKATENLQAKSLRFYRKKFTPEKSIRTSLSDYKKDDDLYNIPLFAIGKVEDILNKF